MKEMYTNFSHDKLCHCSITSFINATSTAEVIQRVVDVTIKLSTEVLMKYTLKKPVYSPDIQSMGKILYEMTKWQIQITSIRD
jgi:hypothetical protein